MANVYAVKSGNWSDVTTWNTGALPTSADDVFSNNFTVTVDISPTVLSVRNGSASGINAGGVFSLNNGITLTCTGSGVVAGTVTCVISNLTGVQSCILTSNVFGGLSSGYGVNNNSTGIFNINGNITGGSGQAGYGCINTSSGTINVVGNVTGGTLNSTYGIINNSSGSVNIIGNVNGSSNSNGNVGVYNIGSGPVNITGNVNGNATVAVQNISSGTINITGTATGGSSVAYVNNSTGTINHTGSAIAGATNAFVNSSTGTITHIGTAQASATAPAIGAGAVGQNTRLTGPLLCTDASFTGASASGVNPCVALRWFPLDTALTTFQYRMRGQSVSGSDRPARDMYFTDAYAATYPATGNVRSGTTYGPGSIYTGTCAVPAAASVVVGAAVDNTVGTAAITAATIRSAVGLASANLDTQLAAKPTATDIRTELDSNSTKLANLDATVSSRLAATSYSTPPSAATNASAVRTELAPELGNLDTTVSSRLASSGYTTPPSATTNASAVRTELASELANLDAAISTRLPTSSYTSPPTAASIRSEIDSNSTKLDATISSRLASASYVTPPTTSAIATAVNSALDRTGFGLTSIERQAIATAVEQSILNESDGQAILNAIVGAIGNTNIDQVTLVAAIRADLERTGGTLATRLAAASYTAPPSAATNASAVRSELGTELARIDTAVSSRLAPSGTLARVTLVDTTTTLTNAPDVPTESEIADAVRTELTPELSRISNAATTQEVGDIVEGAMQLPE